MSKRKTAPHSVKLVHYPKFVFVWPLIVAPGLLLLLEQLGCGQSMLAWLYFSLAGLVLLTLGIDLDRSTAFVFALIGLSAGLLNRLVAAEYGLNLFGTVAWYFGSLDLRYDAGFALALSTLLLVIYVLMFFWARIHSRWEINAFEFKHSSFGVVDHSLARGAKAIRTSYPDILEVVLGLSGSLHVYSANGDKELITIHNIPLLPFVKRRVAQVLNSLPASQAARQEEEAVANG